MRLKRRLMTAKQQLIAAQNLCRQAQRASTIMSARRVLAYQAFAGEISPHLMLAAINIQDYHLPKITNYRRCLMGFYSQRSMDSHNRYGILEPSKIGVPANANSFDLVLVPLVAFDRKGVRIGMGSGYYDRALASLTHQQSTRPRLIGLAHHFQEISDLNPQPWDIPLDAILTDQEFIKIEI